MRRRGFTFFELIICIVVMAIIAVAALPDSGAKLSLEAKLAVDQFESDIAYAKSLSIAEPGNPALIKVDKTNNRYWIARASDPNTPITHPVTKRPYIVYFGPAGGAATSHVQIVGFDGGGDAEIRFDGTGSLSETTPPIMQFSAGAANCEVSVTTGTGKVTVSEVFTCDLTGGVIPGS